VQLSWLFARPFQMPRTTKTALHASHSSTDKTMQDISGQIFQDLLVAHKCCNIRKRKYVSKQSEQKKFGTIVGLCNV